jgi:hypothetical protein
VCVSVRAAKLGGGGERRGSSERVPIRGVAVDIFKNAGSGRVAAVVAVALAVSFISRATHARHYAARVLRTFFDAPNGRPIRLPPICAPPHPPTPVPPNLAPAPTLINGARKKLVFVSGRSEICFIPTASARWEFGGAGGKNARLFKTFAIESTLRVGRSDFQSSAPLLTHSLTHSLSVFT